MTDQTIARRTPGVWIRYALLILIFEKVIQHIFVTYAFANNIGDIRTAVALDYRILMVSGGIVALLFTASLWGMLRRHAWAINLVLALAAFDIVGEFVAQGTVMIVITVSFLVAILLFVLALRSRKLAT